MKDIIDEVKEDLETEKLLKFAKKYGKYFLSVAFIVIASSATYVYINHRNTKIQEDLSYEYYKLFESGKSAAQNSGSYSKIDKLIKNKKSIYAKLAAFKHADELISAKRYDDTIKLLSDIANDPKYEQIANIATIKMSEIVIKYNLNNHRETAIRFLKENIEKKEPFSEISHLLLVQLLIEDNKKEEAVALLQKLNNNDKAPENIKFFTNALLSSIQLK